MTVPRLKKHPSHSSSLPKNLRGIFAGSGTLLNHPEMGPHLLSLAYKSKSQSTSKSSPTSITLLYLGTPSYDLPDKRVAQTSWYVERGCRVISLDVVEKAPETAYMKECVDGADIILVSGGNTSFAMRRWRRLGLDGMMREAVARRGVVMAGGSAGAICWWSGGHSDSIDPDSYKEAKLSSFSSHSDIDDNDDSDEQQRTSPPSSTDGEPSKEWDYIRVDGLSILPGLCCPHHDRIQSNGVLRAHDFDDMMLRHPTEVGICIDHNAAFLVDGDDYRVLYPEHDEAMMVGSVVLPEETFSEERNGVPGVWIKEVVMNGKMLSCRLCPREGKIGELLKVPVRVESSVRHMKVAALENPDDGPMRMSYPGFAARSFFGEGGVGVGKEEFLEMVRGVASGVEEGESGEEEGSEENDGKESKAEEVIGAN